VIAGSPTELQPVLDTVIANAVTLAGANHGHIRQLDGEFLRLAASYNESREQVAIIQATPVRVSQSLAGRAFLEGRPIQSLDAREDPIFGGGWSAVGARSLLAVPLLRKGTPIGNILIWRDFVEPFTERQVDLVKTFADQAVIAIENVRLFNELKESLEQQTATSEILGVIAKSPTDIQPVLDTIAEHAARLCDSADAQIIRVEGNGIAPVATYGTLSPAGHAILLSRGTPAGRAILDRQTLHVHDLAIEVKTEFPDAAEFQKRLGHRTMLVTSLLREGVSIGAILVRRLEVRPFTEKQIKTPGDFRRSSGDSDRKRTAVQRDPGTQRRTAGSSGTPDGDSRGAWHHQSFTHRRAASSRRHRPERRSGLRDRRHAAAAPRERDDGFARSFWSDTYHPRRDQHR
jgi:two-component system NtrC family sensor kinase